MFATSPSNSWNLLHWVRSRHLGLAARALCAGLLCFGGPHLAWSQQPQGEAGSSESDVAPQSSTAERLRGDWEKSIRPLLSQNCLECHDALERSGRLEMETVAGLLRGGLSGPAVDPSQPTKSLLLEVLQADSPRHMPPEGQLSQEEIQTLNAWLARFAEQSGPHPWQADSEAREDKPDSPPNGAAGSDDFLAALPSGVNASQVIDLALEQSWRENGIQPAHMSDDATFARRLYLDLMGRVPHTSELTAFIDSSDSRKREQLVDAILESSEHAAHLAEVFDAVLIGRTNAEQFKRRQQAGWLDYLTAAIEQNRPWNQVAEQIVLARPEADDERGAVWYLVARQNKHQDIAEAVSKDFFGVRIDCAQCHDHPLAAEIEQRHYWGLVAFFNRGSNVETPRGPRVAESAIGGFSEFANLSGKSSINELVFLGTPTLPEDRPEPGVQEEDREDLYRPAKEGEPKVPIFSRREQFVKHVLHDHPLLAQAMVNRMWGWMFGRGLVHPVDALDSFHPASHPELLAWLSRDFAHSNYDLRRLLRHLALSRAYQLDSSPEVGADPQWFSAAIAKPLTAEALLRSFQVALDVEDPAKWNSVEQRTAFALQFPDVLAEESLANVAQGLLLTNGELLQSMISAEHSRTVRRATELDDPQQVTESLFQAILGRSPDATELDRCVSFIQSRTDAPPQAVEGLAWALLTSAEFRFSH